MQNSRGTWTVLLARLSAEASLDLAGLGEERLRRQISARMQARGLKSLEEYLRLLDTNPAEYPALLSALQRTLRRGARKSAGLRSSPSRARLRQWVGPFPLPTLIVEGVRAKRELRLLVCNGPARELLGRPEGTLSASSESHQWLLPDRTPCRDQDLPIHRAVWEGIPTHGQRLLLRDGAGSCLPVIVDAAPMPGHRAWAVETIQAAASWEAGAAPAGQQAATGYYQRVFEESVVPTILTSRSGNILEVNVRAREVLRAHEKELVGAPLAGLLADEALPAYHEAVASLAHSGRARARLTLLAQPDLILDAEAREIRGDAAFIQWVAHDVTSYVATERLRHDLVDLLLHDLRSPLATSILGVETAERALHGQDKPRAQRSLAAAGVALRRLGRLVDSLLDISHLEAGQPLHRLEEVNPVELLHVAAAEVEPALAGPGLDLQLEVPPNLPTIMADGEMFFRVVINLLDNAIKFSPRDGEVQLTATAQDRGVLICVTDRGPGIPRELQPRIFDKFIGYYLPHAPRGYGLGLSFCKLAVEAHGGWLAVDSSPGKGSTFAVWLPNRPG